MDITNLFTLHNPALVRYLRNQFGSDCDDIAQNTWIKVMAKLDSFDPTKEFEPWLFTIARRTGLDHRRRMARRPAELVDDAELSREHADPTLHDPSETVANRDAVSIGLARCADNEREVIRLIADGHTHPEISTRLGIKLGTLKSLICRIRTLDAA